MDSGASDLDEPTKAPPILDLPAVLRPPTGASHALRGTVPRRTRWRSMGAAAGLAAALAGAGIGAVTLGHTPAPGHSVGPTAEHITVSPTRHRMPLSDPQIVGLLQRRPDYGSPDGPLADPQRRASCLSGLGYPTTTPVLGAQPVDIEGQSGVLMLLPADTPASVVALVVKPGCTSTHTGLLADTVVPRP